MSRTMEERIKKFDKLCLDKDEQQQIDKLKVAEHEALQTRSRHASGFAWNSVKAIGFGSAFGAINTVRKACQYNKADSQLREIKNKQADLRQRAKERYEKTMGISVDKTLGFEKGDFCYG